MALIVLCATEAVPQCSDISVGTYDGTPLSGNANTPFSTNTGANNRRGARYQYVYPAAELLAAGVCPGPITRITLYALETDRQATDSIACDPDVDCPMLKVDIRLGHTALTDFGPYVGSQDSPLTVGWDQPTEVSDQLYSFSQLPRMVEAGLMHFQLEGTGFMWDGIHNLVLDISWQRAAPIGISPPVQLVEDLPYTATKWVQVTSGSNPSHGNTYQDDPLTLNSTTGTTFNRPVITFNSTIQELPMTATDAEEAGTLQAYFDPATGEAVVTRPIADQGPWTVICMDITGRRLARRVVPSGTATIRISVSDEYQGVIMLFAVGVDGGRLGLRKLIAMR